MNNIQFKEFSELLPSLLEKADEIAEIFEYSRDDALNLLYYFKWNDYALSEALASANESQLTQIKIKAGIQSANLATIQYSVCPICCTNYADITLKCRHQVCNQCLLEYVGEQLKEKAFIKCFQDQCNIYLPYSFLIQLRISQQYTVKLSKTICQGDNTIKYCKSDRCQYYTDQPLIEQFTICKCGVGFCNQCEYGDHRPMTCQSAKTWISKLTLTKDLLASLDKAKFCPKCRQPIERNQGCNHMTCRKPIGCGHEFCWICLEPWQLHSKETGGYYKCNKFQEQKKANIQKEKSDHEKLLFYSLRYLNHERGKQLAYRKQFKFNRLCEQLLEKIEQQQLYIIKESYYYLIQARQALMWTYCYGYFLEDIKKKALFEFNQADFEKFCENLHELLERNFYIQMKKKTMTKESFQECRQQIVNVYQQTRIVRIYDQVVVPGQVYREFMMLLRVCINLLQQYESAESSRPQFKTHYKVWTESKQLINKINEQHLNTQVQNAHATRCPKEEGEVSHSEL